MPHPIHLHGHDFYLLGTGSGVFSDPAVLKYSNPMRRDVAMLPANGWLVIGFVTDNPGAWLMHCHIVSPLEKFQLSKSMLIMVGLACGRRIGGAILGANRCHPKYLRSW